MLDKERELCALRALCISSLQDLESLPFVESFSTNVEEFFIEVIPQARELLESPALFSIFNSSDYAGIRMFMRWRLDLEWQEDILRMGYQGTLEIPILNQVGYTVGYKLPLFVARVPSPGTLLLAACDESLESFKFKALRVNYQITSFPNLRRI